jgi:hypothetical protein
VGIQQPRESGLTTRYIGSLSSGTWRQISHRATGLPLRANLDRAGRVPPARRVPLSSATNSAARRRASAPVREDSAAASSFCVSRDYQNNNMTQGFHIIHTETATVRIEWSDGTYTDVKWVDHLSFNTGGSTAVFTVAHQESGNRYTTDGVFLSQSTIHVIEHSTITDGVVRVDSVKVRVGC